MKMVQRLIFNLLLVAAMTFALPAVAQAEGGVAEQFNLAPGGTYYFDLSDQNIPGTLNPNLPDPTLRWVPFTYVGTINAYSLGPESSGDIFASDNAAVSDRSLFVAEHGVKGGAAWNSYNAADLIFGKDYQSGGVFYKLRSLSAGNRQRDGYQGGLPESNEWDRILEKNAGYIKNWYYKSYEYDYGYSWCQDTHYNMYVLVPYNFTTDRTVRGFYSPSHFWYGSTDATHALDPLASSPYFFRPALEIRSDPSTVLKTVTFDMGAHGFLGTDTSLTSATVVYTGTITLPNFITDPGFTYFNLGAGWGELCWSDGTNFYEMGNEYDLPTGTTLTPAFRPVTEQYNLVPGGIYYFDLSDQNIPGTVHYTAPYAVDQKYAYAPDSSLKWVPFTYVGTINAYSLDESSVGDASASDNAAPSDRSLFVSACDVTSNVEWDTLKEQGLIFGRDYQSGGVSYKLRSMSMGNRENKPMAAERLRSTLRMLPMYNEWDQMMDKDGVYHFKLWNGTDWPGPNYCMGQDTMQFDSSSRTSRNSMWGMFREPGSAITSYFLAFRPVLEITSDPSTVLKTVTFDLGADGTLGSGMPSGGHDITGFTVAGQVGDSIIDTGRHTVEFHMPAGTDVTGLTPTITVSANATINPASGTTQNFSGPVFYRVIAQNGRARSWKVTCIVGDPAPGGGDGSTAHCHVGDKPDNLALTSATVVYTGSLTLPAITVENGFNYTGSGSGTLGWYDGDTFYEQGATVNLASGTILRAGYSDQSSENDITAFTVTDQVGDSTIDTANHTVEFHMPDGTDVTELTPMITVSANATIDPPSGTAQNFTDPVTYTVTAQDDTPQDWIVTCVVDPAVSSENDITAFTVAGQVGDSTIDTANHTVEFHMPDGTDVTELTPTITVSDNATINPASGTPQDFTNPVTYTVTAQDGTPQDWTVTCVVDPAVSSENDITAFTVAGQVGDSTIDTANHTVEFHMPHGTDVTGLTPMITVSANATINPASGTPQDFTDPVTYTVTTQDGTPQDWTVTCVVDPAVSSENDITAFTVADQVGDSTIHTANHTVEFHMPHGTDVTELTPMITVSANATIDPPSGTAQNFTDPVTYTVTTQDGTPQDWTVTCVVDPAVSSENDITAFTVAGQVGDSTIHTANHTVEFHMPDGTDVTELTPMITVSANATIDPPSGTAQNFTDPVTYTVTAQDGTPQDWTVTCVVDLSATGSISGTVYDDGGGGGPIEGATVTANAGGADYTATTAADGTYTIIDVPAGSGYTVTASKAGYISDTEENVTVTAESTTTVNFLLATPVNGVIIGVAKDSGNNPISGVTVSLSVSGTVYQATTDGNGTYTISNVPAGSGYTVTASKAGYISDTEENVTVTAGSTTLVNFTMSQTNGGEGGGGGGSGSTTPATPAYEADVKAGNDVETTIPVTVDKDTGTASVDASSQNLASGCNVTVTMPSVPGVTNYTIGMPVANLTTPNGGTLTFNTDTGSLTLPSDMLSGITGAEGKKAEISIGQGDKSNLPGDIKAAIGDRPIIQLTLTLDGQQAEWNNPAAPVTISIPYIPTPEELLNPDAIVIWYIDSSGNPVCIPNGHYEPVTGMVTFSTTHFSDFAVAYNPVSFNDVAAGAWYCKPVSFIAARGITGGTGGGNFSPDAKLTRGEFIVLLLRAYGIEPDTNSTDNFSDAGNTYYTGYLAAAKRLGISAGVGNNLFAPEKEITRQEMFTLLYNALKVIGLLPQGDSGKTLSDFSDAGQIDSWAKDAMTILVETGAVGGNNGVLAPLSTTTRAEMAQVLYNLLGK